MPHQSHSPPQRPHWWKENTEVYSFLQMRNIEIMTNLASLSQLDRIKRILYENYHYFARYNPL